MLLLVENSVCTINQLGMSKKRWCIVVLSISHVVISTPQYSAY